MYRLFAFAGVLALAVAFTAVAEDKDKDKDKDKAKDKVPTVKEIMKQAHGEGGLRTQVIAASKKDWKDADKPLETWVKLAADLGKNKQPIGEPDSWKKLTNEYEKTVKELATAVKDRKDDDAKAALKTLTAACGTCHKAHKEDKDDK